ncbi:MAG: hypothetical protein PHE21_02145 [Candidatus Dojkabacteria bacterium]|nr:hypothetical protein [Candidatus Dojkabacteria bacterium]
MWRNFDKGINKYSINIVLVLLLLQIVTIVGGALLFVKAGQTVLDKERSEHATLIFSAISNSFEEILSKSDEDLKRWATEIETGKYDKKPCVTPTTEKISNDSLYSNYAVVDKEGNFICSQMPFPENQTFKTRIKEYEDFLLDNEFRVTGFGIGVDNKPRIVAWYPLQNSRDTNIASVTLGINLEEVNSLINNLSLPTNSQLLITDTSGAVEVVYPSDMMNLGERKFSARIFNLILTGMSGNIEFTDEDNINRFYVYKPLTLYGEDHTISFIIYGVDNSNYGILFTEIFSIISLVLISIVIIGELFIIIKLYKRNKTQGSVISK